MKGIKKILGLVVLGSIVIGNLIGCGAKTEETVSENKTESVEESVVQSTIENVAESSAEAENKSAEVPKGFNYVPLKNTEGREIKIATLTVSNNPFWNTVVEGIDAAKEYLADSNVTVDVIEFEDFDGQAFAEAIDTCIVKGYDAITTVGVADTIVPAINKATDAGIPVYTFNSDTEKESKRVAFVGQDLYTAGGVAAQKRWN